MTGRLDPLARRLDDRFGLLLASLVVSFLVTGLEGGRAISLVAGTLNTGSLVLGLLCTGIRLRSPTSMALVALAVASVVTVALAPIDSLISAIGAMTHALLLGVLTAAIVGRVIRHHRVTVQTILGAVAAYFLIGQAFAWAYLALPGLTGESVLDPPSAGQLPIYFSYVVLATVGFGDVTPATPFAQRLTVIEALLAQIFLAVLVARLVSVYSSDR